MGSCWETTQSRSWINDAGKGKVVVPSKFVKEKIVERENEDEDEEEDDKDEEEEEESSLDPSSKDTSTTGTPLSSERR